ncbi:MAG: type II toxin-antitoxin system prevent-host-death family antitoxin [Verrucomicrobiota bacterium]
MKEIPRNRLTDCGPISSPPVLKEVAVMSGLGETISVRAAKAHLSGLLDLVAAGREIIITSDGKPKARVVPMDREPQWKPFTGTDAYLRAMPPWRGGLTGEEILREDRDGRG